MPSLKVRMFGDFCVEYDGEIWSWQESRKSRELFCYLLIHPTLRHQREHLAEMLWCESPTATAKKNLRQALWQLQSKFAEYQKNSSHQLFYTEPECLSLHPALDVWIDVRDFEEECKCLNDLTPLDRRRAQVLQQAAELYQGDLLEGWYQDWCLCERERLQNLYLTLLDRLIVYCEQNREYETGIRYGERLLRFDFAGERAHQHMILLKHLSGDRTGALRQYEQCVKALKDEFGVHPGRRTCELYEQIRSDQSSARDSYPAAALLSQEPALLAVEEMLSQLRKFQETLSFLQQQARRWIQIVERLDSGQRKE